jgi:hypothetical protein
VFSGIARKEAESDPSLSMIADRESRKTRSSKVPFSSRAESRDENFQNDLFHPVFWNSPYVTSAKYIFISKGDVQQKNLYMLWSSTCME